MARRSIDHNTLVNPINGIPSPPVLEFDKLLTVVNRLTTGTIGVAGPATDGILSSSDWNKFNDSLEPLIHTGSTSPSTPTTSIDTGISVSATCFVKLAVSRYDATAYNYSFYEYGLVVFYDSCSGPSITATSIISKTGIDDTTYISFSISGSEIKVDLDQGVSSNSYDWKTYSFRIQYIL